MRVLALDPGAERMGWCVLEGERVTRKNQFENKPPVELGADVFKLERGRNEGSEEKEAFQNYRLRLIEAATEFAFERIQEFSPDVVVGETVPAIGGGNFRGGAVQSQLAETSLTTCFVVARIFDVDVAQVGATSVKARIGGSNRATKVRVRNGVTRIMPQIVRLTDKTLRKLPDVKDQSDAFGVGLTYLGYDLREGK